MNQQLLLRAINKGRINPVAIMAKKESLLKLDIPILRVDNTYHALKKLALKATDKVNAKRVVVTGSYGKTGFKVQLNEVLKNQLSIQATLNSANQMPSLYANITSLSQDNDLMILEVPLNTPRRTKQKSSFIQPDICVLTSIGHEHIEAHGSIEKIIKGKVAIADSLNKHGKFIIPKGDKHYQTICKELESYPDVDIVTFGHDKDCNARIISQSFNDFGWDVEAQIEDAIVKYYVPFPEIYAPASSLAVLLSVYYLHQDVKLAASYYYLCTNYKSSGVLYDVYYQNKQFQLYDQSFRGGLEGYENFFKSLSYIKPNGLGKKILLTSEFVDYEDGEMELIDHSLFQKLIKDAQIDSLYTVEKFTEHIEVLEDKNIWKNHSYDFSNIKEEILDCLNENDILCVKGIYECNLAQFVSYIKKLDGIRVVKKLRTNVT